MMNRSSGLSLCMLENVLRLLVILYISRFAFPASTNMSKKSE